MWKSFLLWPEICVILNINQKGNIESVVMQMSSGKKKGLTAVLAAGGLMALAGVYFSMSYGLKTLEDIRPREFLTYISGGESWRDRQQYAEAFDITDDYEERLKYTDAYLGRYPDSQLAMTNKAYLLISDGQNEEGILLNRKVLGMHGADSTAYNNIGWAYINLGQYHLAVYYLEQAIAANGGEPTYYELANLGDAYQGLEAYETAVDYYRQANRKLPADLEDAPLSGHYGLAETYRLMGRSDKALEIYRKILDIVPSDYESYTNIMEIYEERGETERLVSFGKEYLEDNPDAIYVYSNIAYALYELEEFEHSAEYYLLYAEHSDYPAYGYCYAAEAYLMAGDREKARLYAEIALEADPSYSVYLTDEELWGWLDD